jgi:hypothetical protein
MSLFGDVAPGSPQSTTKPQQRGGAGFDSIFIKAPMAVVKLMGRGFVGFIYVLVGSSKKSKKVYYTSGPSWRKWPW